MRVLEADEFHVIDECWEELRGCALGHRLFSVLLCQDADMYRRSLLWVGVVGHGVVDGCGCFWEGVVEYGVLSILLFVCVCGDVSQSCEKGNCTDLLRGAGGGHVDVQCFRVCCPA